jgi:hypothetical protein
VGGKLAEVKKDQPFQDQREKTHQNYEKKVMWTE